LPSPLSSHTLFVRPFLSARRRSRSSRPIRSCKRGLGVTPHLPVMSHTGTPHLPVMSHTGIASALLTSRTYRAHALTCSRRFRDTVAHPNAGTVRQRQRPLWCESMAFLSNCWARVTWKNHHRPGLRRIPPWGRTSVPDRVTWRTLRHQAMMIATVVVRR
jgi:hypothetical protein